VCTACKEKEERGGECALCTTPPSIICSVHEHILQRTPPLQAPDRIAPFPLPPPRCMECLVVCAAPPTSACGGDDDVMMC
jgi:hypothetical protein